MSEDLEGVSPLAAPASRIKPARTPDSLSLAEWQDWIVDLIIKKHDEGCSDNQVRMIFGVQFDQRMSALWEIVQEVATGAATIYEDAYGDSDCPFCNSTPLPGVGKDHVTHEETCIVTKARKLVAERPANGKNNLRTEA